MADPASLTLGLAPIVGALFKSYRTVYKKMKVFHRANQEVNRLQKELRRQREVFKNEMHLLLRLVLIDEKEIGAMVNDGDHERWASSDLNELFKARLPNSYECFQAIVEDIGTDMEYLLKELKCFESLDQCSREKGTTKLREQVHRIQSAAKLTFDKSKCDEAIQSLRTANDDLKRLREQALDLEPNEAQHKDRRSELGSQLRPSYGHCSKIRRATRELYEGLSKTLASHYHDVRLFLEATVVEDNTITDLAILCASQQEPNRRIVQVRSRPVDWLPTSSQTPDPCTGVVAVVDRPRKRRKVRWLDEQAGSESGEVESEVESKQTSHPAQDLCLEICRGNGCHDEHGAKGCLCYVETSLDQAFRHEFYSHGGTHHHPTELATFDDILQLPVETSISIVDQLKLARTIVSAVLYFSSTPWLAEYWSMKDLCFFLDRNDLSTSLRTLNLGVRFIGSEASQVETVMEEIDPTSAAQESQQAIEDTMLMYGIRNLTLHSLGVVLLQIGRWGRIEPDDILEVRRLAQQVPRLGPKYRDMMQQCLHCDFGRGSNLSRPQLQQAVYEDVVEELDDMIRCLDIFKDDGAS